MQNALVVNKRKHGKKHHAFSFCCPLFRTSGGMCQCSTKNVVAFERFLSFIMLYLKWNGREILC